MTKQQLRSESMKRFGFGPDVMKSTRICRVCGMSCAEEKDYCPDCGAILPRETLFDLYKGFHLYCPVCDTVVSNTSIFCPTCGKQLQKIPELQKTK